MTAQEEWVLDPWTPASHKTLVGDRAGYAGGVPQMAPTWIVGHERRLGAYKTYEAFTRNAARHLRPTKKKEDRDEFREYGDAALIVRMVLAALLGDDYTISVDGAELYDPDLDKEAKPLVDVDPDTGDPVERPVDPPDPEKLAQNEEARRAIERQEWLQEWADKERWAARVYEGERNAVKLGDNVYVLGWSTKKKRARLRVYDPGFYFPVLDDGDDEDFPRRVHIAWDVDEEPSGRMIPPGTQTPTKDSKTKVRRITWELVEGEPYQLPWNDEMTTTHCLMSDAVFEISSSTRSVDDFSLNNATFRTNEDGEEVRDLDIGVDFIPVIHVPNTIAGAEHYGESSLASILQILDDLSAADTDLAAAARLVGIPPLALSGVTSGSKEIETYGPGQVFKLGPDGALSQVDTSGSLAALAAYIDGLLARLAVNARMPESVLGRVKPSEVPSGVALALSFGPLQTMIAEMRLVRSEKYTLLLRFVQRFAILFGELKGEVMTSTAAFGSFLPSDRKAIIDECAAAVEAGTMSRLTAVRIMMAAGVDVEDAQAEVDRIQAEDFAGAAQLVDATGDDAAGRRYLGLEGAPPRPQPPPPPENDPDSDVPPEPPPGRRGRQPQPRR